MANTIEVKVPDIGDFDGVPVIELLVSVGDTVKRDQGLVTLESDKATMEVPSSAEGVVREIRVKVGDKVAEGALIAVLEAASNDVAGDTSMPSADATVIPSPPRSGGEGRGEGGSSPSSDSPGTEAKATPSPQPSPPLRGGEGADRRAA